MSGVVFLVCFLLPLYLCERQSGVALDVVAVVLLMSAGMIYDFVTL